MAATRYTIGIDVGGTKTALGLFDGAMLLTQSRRPSDVSLPPEEFFDALLADVAKILADAGAAPDELRGVGVALPSFLRQPEGYILKTANLPLLREFPAREYLANRLHGVKIAVGNDNHAAALAEHRHGAGRGHDNMLYCLMSTGIASGIIIDGRLFRGDYGFSGESGHMIVTPGEGPLCGCGNRGCLSAYASAALIPEHLRSRVARGEATSLTEPYSMEQIADAYTRGDALAVRALDQMTRYMAVWLYNLYVTLNIRCFVFGGGLLNMRLPL
ncbi:MAG: ROK family protein, partial [Oscillospiraceae bacterium]|nr:ROK family protein [Oscillospiraceae bacterium]